MSDAQNRYVEAARSDFDSMKQEFDKVRDRLATDGDQAKPDSELLDTAWSDLQSQWDKLQKAGNTASSELKEGFNDARDRFQRVLQSYRNPKD